MAELRCDGVAKSYGARPVLLDVDLLVPEGTLTAILGASGSGKTTLLRIVMGFAAPDAGSVSVGGKVLAGGSGATVAADKRAIGYVAQEGALFPHLTAGENVGFGLPRGQRRTGARIVEALELVGLDGTYADRRSNELSGGEQRRVALARALAPRPQLVLLDEPFSGLDAGLRAETREAVLHALAQEGATALLVTHDQAEAMSMGHEVVVLREGRLVQRAVPTTVYRSPIDAAVARFVGDAILLPGVAADGRVRCALGELELRAPAPVGPVEVMVRPEQIRMRRGAGATSTRGVRARVIDCTFYGPDTVVALALEAAAQPAIRARTFDQEIPAAGELIVLSVAGSVIGFASETATA